MPRLRPNVHADALEPASLQKRPAGSAPSAAQKHNVVRRSSTGLIRVIQDGRSRPCPLRRLQSSRGQLSGRIVCLVQSVACGGPCDDGLSRSLYLRLGASRSLCGRRA